MRTWYTELGVALDLSEVDLPDGVQVYLCGPLPFMQMMRAQLVVRGVSPASIHYEVFGPDLWLQVA
jgi:nitric oxide dioxygenase